MNCTDPLSWRLLRSAHDQPDEEWHTACFSGLRNGARLRRRLLRRSGFLPFFPFFPSGLLGCGRPCHNKRRWDLTRSALPRPPRLTHNSSRSLPHIQQRSRRPLSDSRNVPRNSSPASICGTHVGGPAVPAASRHGGPLPSERTKMTHRVFEWGPERNAPVRTDEDDTPSV